MALTTLKPRLSSSQGRLKTLNAPIGMTERPRGRAWMDTRNRIALAHKYKCAGCGLTWFPGRDKIDHIVPRWKGGGDQDANLQPLCEECHQAKTAREAAERARGY